MTAPDTTDVEPTLAEAFTELAEGIANAEEQGGDITGHPQAPQQTAEDRELAAEGSQAADGQAAGGQQAGDQRAPAEAEERHQAARSSAQLAADATGTADEAAEQSAAPQAEPLIYNVDGQQRAFDGGFYVPGQGLIFTEEARGRVLDVLQRSERLSAQNQQLYAQTQDFQKLGGRAAFEKLQGEKAMLDASATLLLRALSDENTLVSLATDPVARQQLIKEITLTAREAQFNAANQAREQFQRESTQAVAAQQTQTAIFNAVGAIAQEFQGLTADDIQAVRTHAGRMHTAIVRPATPDEAREAQVQVGAPIIDIPLLREILKDRHALRQSAVEAAQRRQTDAQDNAARAAAAAPTRVAPNGRTPPRPGPGMPSSDKKKVDQMSYTELTRAMRSGRIIDLLEEEDAQQ